jgi:CopA family copper-resistance protein
MYDERIPERQNARPMPKISRRRFVQGLIAGGVVGGLELSGTGWRHWPAAAAAANPPQVLSGKNIELVIEPTRVNYTGYSATATAINGSVPGPLLRLREGDDVTISVTNRMPVSTSIHWHGFRIPADMDGVPGLSYRGIDPGQTFVYRFQLKQRGTYWYHSHTRFQEQTGLYGPVIIEPAFKSPVDYDREHIVLLSDWTDQNPETVFSNLKQQSDYYNFHQRTAGTFIADARKNGLGPTIKDRLTWGRMDMSPTDILDVGGATYTYLANGRPPAANWTGLFRAGERVRLRFINGSSMTIFDVRIPGLPMTVVQTDGNDVEPVTVDEFRISVAETYDVIVQPGDAAAYTIFAQSEDRTGYARGTLAPRYGMTAAIPPMDRRPLRTMMDMGMCMKGMNMGATPGMRTNNMPGMDMGDMPGMDMSGMTAPPPPIRETARREYMTGEEAPGQPGPHTSAQFNAPDMGDKKAPPANPIRLKKSPAVDNVADCPTERMAQPSRGMTGRRVLDYTDLRAIYRGTDPRPPSRDIELHLTGNMERFIWGFDGKKFSEAEPIRLKLGERVRITLINDSMMEHPIHLHGLWSELENGNGEFRPYKHTINVRPGERLSYLVSADTPGKWAYHCHLLYHMEAGMFRTVIVE